MHWMKCAHTNISCCSLNHLHILVNMMRGKHNLLLTDILPLYTCITRTRLVAPYTSMTALIGPSLYGMVLKSGTTNSPLIMKCITAIFWSHRANTILQPDCPRPSARCPFFCRPTTSECWSEMYPGM